MKEKAREEKEEKKKAKLEAKEKDKSTLQHIPASKQASSTAENGNPALSANNHFPATNDIRLTPQALGLTGISNTQAIPSAASSSTNLSAMLKQALTPNTQVITNINQTPPISPMIDKKQTPLPIKPTITSPAMPQLTVAPVITTESLFEYSNQLTQENKQIILQFLSGNRVNPDPGSGAVRQILLNYEKKINPQNNTPYLEQLIFEINYENGTWRKLRRKRNLPKETPDG